MKVVPTTRRVLLISLAVDFIDIVTNLVVVLLTGSAVIFAELLQGVIDFIGTAFLAIGQRQSHKPKDQVHPLGYQRDVFFWSLVSAFMMLFVGSPISIYGGYHQVVSPEILNYKELALIVLIISVVTNGYALLQSWIKIQIPGRSFFQSFQESSQQLVKTALIRDLLGTAAAIVGLTALGLYEFTDLVIFDGLGAISIGIMMGIFAIILINQSRHLLVGRTVSTKVIHRIRQSTIKIPEVIDINRLIAIYVGNDQILVDLDVELVDRLSTTKIEEVLDKIKETIIHDVPETQSVQIDLNAARLREKVTIEKIT